MPEQTTRQIVPQGNKGSLPAQRTYGTTDPGGVWHPVDRRECLTILLGTYAENGQCNRPTTNALYSVQPACACALASLCSYRLVFAADAINYPCTGLGSLG